MFDRTNTASDATPLLAETMADATGLLVGSQIATAFGWLAVEGYGLAHPQTPRDPIEVVILEFAEDEVVYGDNGVLFHISKGYDLLADDQPNSNYKVLDAAETIDILSELYEAYLDA